jgi:membrane-bound ClpP family serine protease
MNLTSAKWTSNDIMKVEPDILTKATTQAGSWEKDCPDSLCRMLTFALLLLFLMFLLLLFAFLFQLARLLELFGAFLLALLLSFDV